jgi:hypothetical protein
VDEKFKMENLKSLTTGFVAIADTPANHFVEELTKLYPDAIVICTTRERDAWWKSAEPLAKNTRIWWLGVMVWPMPTLRWFQTWVRSASDR